MLLTWQHFVQNLFLFVLFQAIENLDLFLCFLYFVIYSMPFLVDGMSVLHKLAEEDDGCFELALSSYDICHI